MLPRKRYFSRTGMPSHHVRLEQFSTSGTTGVISSWTSPNPFSESPPVPPNISSALDCHDAQRSGPSVLLLDAQPSRTTQPGSLPLSIPARLEDCDRPTTALGSRQKGIDSNSEAGTSSSRTAALESLASRFCTSADQGTSMRARRRRRDTVTKSSNITGARSDLSPEAILSSSDDFPISTFRSSGLPPSHTSNLTDVSLVRKDAKKQAVKRIPKSIPGPPRSRLVSESLDEALIQLESDEESLDEDNPPCASGKAQKGRRTNDYRISSRLRDTSSPDCFLRGDSVSSFGSAALEWQDHDLEDIVFFIPPDCPTSTPVASRKRASSKGGWTKVQSYSNVTWML
ncbi:hypothetical protein BGY98DRAFT_967794 [Russula aff. rugulosa BPL654]|nr:hypothetical protein BGY98DRAFT_967794 [Russula aff. rugulosa BPL654]